MVNPGVDGYTKSPN